jgi:hypothetical protein
MLDSATGYLSTRAQAEPCALRTCRADIANAEVNTREQLLAQPKTLAIAPLLNLPHRRRIAEVWHKANIILAIEGLLDVQAAAGAGLASA